MACEFICDGCGARQKAVDNGKNFFKPDTWYQRSDDDGIQVACSRECITKIAEKSGKTDTICPI